MPDRLAGGGAGDSSRFSFFLCPPPSLKKRLRSDMEPCLSCLSASKECRLFSGLAEPEAPLGRKVSPACGTYCWPGGPSLLPNMYRASGVSGICARGNRLPCGVNGLLSFRGVSIPGVAIGLVS